ncbi:flavodoxin family protein [Clostridium senegalense]
MIIHISYCEGRETCFQYGFCPLDEKDDLKKIRAQLYDSDIVFFASPVYVHGIPGKMNTLFDKIASYTHLLNYAGKLGFTVTTAMNNGQDIVRNYIMDIQESIGVKNLDNYIFLKENNSLENFLKA